MYSKIVNHRNLNIAGAALFEGRLVLRTEGILIPAPIAEEFGKAPCKLFAAYVEQSSEFRGRGSALEKSIAVLDTTGTGMIAEMGNLVRAAIRSTWPREQSPRARQCRPPRALLLCY
jgi:hypothetical protein